MQRIVKDTTEYEMIHNSVIKQLSIKLDLTNKIIN